MADSRASHGFSRWRSGARRSCRIRRGLLSAHYLFFFSSRRRHTRFDCDWSSDVCSSDLVMDFFAPPIVFPNVTYTNQSALSTSAAHAQTKQIGSFSVTLDLLPGRFGKANTVIVLINDGNGKPVTDAQVQLITTMTIMNMGIGHVLLKDGNPIYTTTFGPHEALSS